MANQLICLPVMSFYNVTKQQCGPRSWRHFWKHSFTYWPVRSLFVRIVKHRSVMVLIPMVFQNVLLVFIGLCVLINTRNNTLVKKACLMEQFGKLVCPSIISHCPSLYGCHRAHSIQSPSLSGHEGNDAIWNFDLQRNLWLDDLCKL